jgi:hypothetical protein
VPEEGGVFDIKEISQVIAERRLYLEDQPESSIRILLGKPQRVPSPSNKDFVLCPYQILGIGDEKVRSAGGVDEVQALQLAMEMIGSELYFKLNRRYNGKLRWEAGKQGDLGFPVPPGLEQEKTREV